MTTFLDTNVIIALLDDKSPHHRWSTRELIRRKTGGPTIIPDIVYCEMSIGMNSRSDLDDAIFGLGIERVRSDDEVLFRAGRAFKDYRKANKGPKLGVLPDFLIGAVAEVYGAPLMTANPKDFITYFPAVELISP